MKPRKWSILLIIMLTIALVAGYGIKAPALAQDEGEGQGEEGTPEATRVPQGSIAVVMTGPWDDNSWNEAAYNALETLKEEGVKTAYSENISDTDVARVLREYVDQGFGLIVAHSFIYQDATFEVADESPNTNFAWAGGIDGTSENVADYDQPFYEAAYPIGVLAGYMSKSGALGALYGFDIPVCHSMGEAFLAGAKSVNPDATLAMIAVGDWADVAKAKEAALAQADLGVDFWIECGEGPALGAIEAAEEVGGYATGYVGDMSENGPDVVLSSLVWNLEPLFAQMLIDTENGTFANQFYRFGIAEGVMQVQYNEALKADIPQDAIDAVDQAMADIASGDLVVEFVPE